ncbi:MAG: pyrroline-5-carboxylate reductase [bacterium]|nr:pyrroline-5-carboxylate reductase [bacterium]
MNFGFIGTGNLGGSVVKGLFNAKFLNSDNAYISEPNADLANMFKDKYGANTVENNSELVNKSDVIFIAVKPYLMTEVLTGIKDGLTRDKLVISLAAGYTTEMMASIAPDCRFIRVLTNTPAALNAATSTISKGNNATNEDIAMAEKIFSMIGSASIIDEKFMDLSTALAGSGPAFFYAVANAFAKGCEQIGLDKDVSILMSAQTMLGAAKMLLDSGKNPQTLIKEVTTPNGCTYEGLKYMDEHNAEDILAQTMVVTTQRAATLAKK